MSEPFTEDPTDIATRPTELDLDVVAVYLVLLVPISFFLGIAVGRFVPEWWAVLGTMAVSFVGLWLWLEDERTAG